MASFMPWYISDAAAADLGLMVQGNGAGYLVSNVSMQSPK